MVGRWGKCLVEHCTFQNQNPVWVFLYHCISEGNRLFSENVHFILHITLMSDKAAFVSGALFCVERYCGNCCQRMNLHIYVATNSVTLWDDGINKLNCTTVSGQFML